MAVNFDLIQTVTGILGGSGVIGFLGYLYNSHTKRIRIKLVKNKNDPDVDDFILLYDEVIDENIRVSPEEITKLIGCHKPTNQSTICDYLFFCKVGEKLVGFLKTLYCCEDHILFIAYLGIDIKVEEARKEAAIKFYKKLLKLLKSQHKDCKAILFEIDKSNLNKSAAKLRLFKNVIERYGYKCKAFDIKYFQPEMPSDRGSIPKEETALFFVPIDNELSTLSVIDKNMMLDYLKFIYLKLYIRFYDDDELHAIYEIYLNDLIRDYERILPDKIKLI